MRGYVVAAYLASCMTIEPPPMADIGFRLFGHVDDVDDWKQRYWEAIEAARRVGRCRGSHRREAVKA